MKHLLKILVFIPLICSSCALNSSSITDPIEIREAAMQDGMKIVAMTKYGEFIVSAGRGTERSYTWDGQTVKVNLVPRKERWYGVLGLIDGNDIRPPHKEVVHVIIQEGQIHYQSIDDATKTMNTYAGVEDLYRDDGLFIRFQKKQNPENGKYAIDITIYQIMINGQKPTNLPGSQNDKIIASNAGT